MKTFIVAGLAKFHRTSDEQFQDVLLYRGIFSVLQLSCSNLQLQKILPECYSIMFSQDLATKLTKSYSSLSSLFQYMETIPSVTTSPLYKVFLLKQTTQLPTLAKNYKDDNLNNAIMEYQLRLVELSRRTSLGVSIPWLMCLTVNQPNITDRIKDYLNSRSASAETSHIEIDEILSEFQSSNNIILSTQKLTLPRRDELKILLTEQFESISYICQKVSKGKTTTEATTQIAAYKPTPPHSNTPKTTSLCPHRANHSNCSIKQLGASDWGKAVNLLFYMTRTFIFLHKKCTLDQADSTLDSILTEGNFGRAKSLVYKTVGEPEPELNKPYGRQKRQQTHTHNRHTKLNWNRKTPTEKPDQSETDFHNGSM